jgi:hypothetical protein
MTAEISQVNLVQRRLPAGTRLVICCKPTRTDDFPRQYGHDRRKRKTSNAASALFCLSTSAFGPSLSSAPGLPRHLSPLFSALSLASVSAIAGRSGLGDM